MQQAPGCPGRSRCTHKRTHQLLQNNCCSLVMAQTKHHLLHEQWKCPAPTITKSFRSFSMRLPHLIWVACNMSITQGHCFGGRAAHCSLRDHQEDVPVDDFAVQEVKRAKLLHGVPTRPQHAPFSAPTLQSIEPSHPLSRVIGTDLQELSLSLSTFSSLLLP